MLIRVLSGLYVYDFLEIVKPICSFSLLTSLGRLKYVVVQPPKKHLSFFQVLAHSPAAGKKKEKK